MTRDEQIYKASDKYESYRESRGVKDPIALDEIGEAFYAGAKWADRNPADRWISVEDELPKECGWYLIYDASMSHDVCMLYGDCWGNCYNVTHWQPLPPPPSVSSDDKEGGEL